MQSLQQVKPRSCIGVLPLLGGGVKRSTVCVSSGSPSIFKWICGPVGAVEDWSEEVEPIPVPVSSFQIGFV